MNSSISLHSADDYEVSLASAYLKLALLAATGIAVHFSMTPPNIARPKTVVARASGSFFERCVQWYTFCTKMLVWIMVVADATVTYMQVYNSPAGITEFSASTIPTSLEGSILYVSPVFLLGTAFVVFASVLRQWCYRQLGPFFTFEISIQPDHMLVTSGPYSVVRHPSYTGIYLTLIGSTLVGFAQGSYLREFWLAGWTDAFTSRTIWGKPMGLGDLVLSTMVQFITLAAVFVWLAIMANAMPSTIKRLHVEDNELHKLFGKEWEAWAEKVRWKMVPGVF